MFWIAAALLLGLTCLSLLSALGRSAPESKSHDRVFYEAQLVEIERQRGLSLIADAEAAAAKTEAARRLLSTSVDFAPVGATADTSARKWAAVCVLVLIPVVSLPVYLTRGSPEMPSFPLANRKPPAAIEDQGLNLAVAIQQIEAHLAKIPEDGRGHEVIAPVYARTGRHEDAVRAYASALRLLGASAVRYGNLGEAMVFQFNGVVTQEAKAAFGSALALDAQHVKARFFLALAAQQDGDIARATSLLTQLRSDIPEGDLKTEISNQLRIMADVPQGGGAVAVLPKAQQDDVIRAMVDRLAQRLATTGGSVEEWAKLIRALTVLKETERAGLIASEARKKFAANPDHILMIEDAAKAIQ